MRDRGCGWRDGGARYRARVRPRRSSRDDPRTGRDPDAGDGGRGVLSGSGAVHRRCGTRTRSSRGCATCCGTARRTCSTSLFAAGATEIPFAADLPPTLTDRSAAPGRRGSGRARVPAHHVRMGVAARGARASRASSSTTASRVDAARLRRRRPAPRHRVWPASTADLVIDARGPRSTSDSVAGRDRRAHRCRRSCTRAASSTSRASTG